MNYISKISRGKPYITVIKTFCFVDILYVIFSDRNTGWKMRQPATAVIRKTILGKLGEFK